MPRKSTQSKQVDRLDNPPPQPLLCTKDAAWGGFINVSLDTAQDADFEATWKGHFPAIQEWLTEQQVAGRQFSSRYVAEDQCFLVSLTGRCIPEYDTRWSLTARSPVQAEALALLWYKDVRLLHGDWGSWRPAPSRRNRG